jgi:ribonuclease HI
VKTLRLFTDGAARGNPGPAGLGLVVEGADGVRLWGGCRYIGTATNNTAEYLALIEGLKKVADWSPERLEIYLDSQLVVEQMMGRYKIKKPELQALAQTARSLLNQFPNHSISYVPREKNKGADALANKAIDEYKPS